jgi:hypothetical protein
MQLKSGNPTTIEFSDDNGATFTDAVFASITGVNVNGLGGRDLLDLRNDNGLIAQAGLGLPIAFDGGTGYNSIQLTGSPSDIVNETFTATAADSATLDLIGGTATTHLMMARISHVFDKLTADSLTIDPRDLPGVQNNAILIRGQVMVGGVVTNTVAGVDFHHVHDDGAFHNDMAQLGIGTEPTPDQGDDGDHGHGEDNPNELTFSSQFIPVTYANKTHVVVNALGGDDYVLIHIPQVATGEQSMVVDGGTGFNVLAFVGFNPGGVSLTTPNFQRTDSAKDAIFVDTQYELSLARPAEDAAFGAWKQLLDTQGPAAIVTGIDGSIEARGVFVRHGYERLLGRDPTPSEQQAWANALLSGALTEEQVLQDFLGSIEFYAYAQSVVPSGVADQRYVRALYQLVLGRPATDSETQAWVDSLSAIDRNTIAAEFIASPEFRGNFVTSLYSDVLHRLPASQERTLWVISNVSLQEMRQQIEGSQEAFLFGITALYV